MIDRIQSGKKQIFKWVPAALFLMVLLDGVALPHESEGDDLPDAVESDKVDEEEVLLKAVFEKFEAKAYREVIDLVDQYFEKHPLTDENIYYVHLKANAHLAVKEIDEAIAAYEKSLPMIRNLHNVGRRKFARLFFILGDLYHETGKQKKAISFLEEGLTLEPQNTAVQIILGEYYAQAGRKEQAVSHYRELLDGPGL